MIVYFDTSALLPLLVEEPGSRVAVRLWEEADHVVSVRLLYAEARAALAQAERIGRIERHELGALVEEFETVYAQLDQLEVDDALVRRAGALAQEHGLRGYDAVHLAGAERVNGTDLVLVAGDSALLGAARTLGISVARTA